MPEMAGGERPRRPSQLSSPILRRHGREAAAHCFRRCYETWPELDARYGEWGRQFVAEDAFWHLEHLDAAIEVEDPAVFADYADWVTGLLGARGIGPEQVAGAFGFLAEALEKVACPAAQETHRERLVAVLRDNQARILRTPPPRPQDPGSPA
jgi:hypothetical protein